MKGKLAYLQHIKETAGHLDNSIDAIRRRYAFRVSILEHLEERAKDANLPLSILFVDNGFELMIAGHTLFTTNIIQVKQIIDLALDLKGAQ